MEPTAHVHPPKQIRSRRTLERLVGASLAILEEEGPDALTVQAIVERAKSSVGSFYARFDGKDDLLEYLGARLWSEATERWNEVLAGRTWEDESLADLARGAVRLLDEAGRTRGTTLKALNQAGGGGDAYVEFRDHVLDGLGTVLLSRRQEITHPDPQTAVRLGLMAVAGLLDRASAGRLPGTPTRRLVEESERLLLGYLQPGEDVLGSGEGVEFFDIWG